MIVSTSIRPYSSPSRQRGRFNVANIFFIVMAVIVTATTIIGLGYVPVVSARMPQLASLTTAVEDAVGDLMDWSRGMIRQARPVRKPQAAAPKPVPVPPKTAPVVQRDPAQPTPVTQKPAQAPKPAVKPTTVKKPLQPGVRPRARASDHPLLRIGSRAPQFAAKDLRGVIYRLSDYRGYRLSVLIVSSLDEGGRQAVRAYLDRFAFHPGYVPIIIITSPDRVAVRRLALASAGSRVAILLGDKDLEDAYRLPHGGEALYVISERGAIAQARAFGGR